MPVAVALPSWYIWGNARVAKWIRQRFPKPPSVGSIPAPGTIDSERHGAHCSFSAMLSMLQCPVMSSFHTDSPTEIYSTYARVYDRSGQMRFAIMMGMYLTEVLARHEVSGRSMLDLACGTGTLALQMAEAGWSVTGIDRSPAMLDEARRKHRASSGDVTFIEGDMRVFTAPEPVDLLTCCYDSLNYLLAEDELRACVHAMAKALVPGGLLCFDLATEYFLREYWRGVEEHHGAGYDYTIASSFDEPSGYSTLTLEGVVQDADGDEQPLREVHVERAHATGLVEQLLDEAGLVREAVYDCFTFQPPTPQSLRHFWVVRKPGNCGGA
jgi:SAM-dependent methyltransferase